MAGQAIKNEVFLAGMVSSAVIDTACSRNVADKQWFHNYLKHLDGNSLNNVKITPSKVPLKIGDGCKLYCLLAFYRKIACLYVRCVAL